MNRSYSKIRHIQEANVLLEKKLLSEAPGITYGNEPAPIAGVTDPSTVQPTSTTPVATTPAATTTVATTQSTEAQTKELQGKENTAKLVETLQNLLKDTYKQNIVPDKKYGPKTAQAILNALKSIPPATTTPAPTTATPAQGQQFKPAELPKDIGFAPTNPTLK